MCEYGNETPLDDDSTYAPTPTPDPPITFQLGDTISGLDIAENQSAQYTIDVSGLTGIVRCEVEADSGE